MAFESWENVESIVAAIFSGLALLIPALAAAVQRCRGKTLKELIPEIIRAVNEVGNKKEKIKKDGEKKDREHL